MWRHDHRRLPAVYDVGGRVAALEAENAALREQLANREAM